MCNRAVLITYICIHVNSKGSEEVLMRIFCLDRKACFGLSLVVSLGLSAGLMACGGESSSASSDEPEADATLVCSKAIEDSVVLRWEGNPKYGHGYYEKCTDGKWIEVSPTDVQCPKDAAVGDTCIVEGLTGFFHRFPVDYIYIYSEENQWTYLDPAACAKDREGELRSSYNYGKVHYDYERCVNERWTRLTYDEVVKIEMEALPQDAAEGDSAASKILERDFVFADGQWQMTSNVSEIETPCTMKLDKEVKSVGFQSYVCRGIYGEWKYFTETYKTIECTKEFLWDKTKLSESESGDVIRTGCYDADKFPEPEYATSLLIRHDFEDDVTALSFAPAARIEAVESDITAWEGLCFAYTSSVPLTIALDPNNDYDSDAFGNYFGDDELEMYSVELPVAKKRNVVDLKWEDFKAYSGIKVDLGLERTLTMVEAVHIVESVAGPADFTIEQIGSLGQCK